ncbi:unnamed protein product [Lactuca virosa]|uniref:DUF4218 domain-containing protein n=1 Tax=Lactuca virosa TaxID=75947 RepID=A0AAU9MKT1_9ASTR|nr:unnamed protein product [Lactuca virosa]
MYPIKRYLLTLKSYVHNRAHPEGSIVEGYLAQESVIFCSRCLSGVETIFTRPIRNDDEGHQNEIEESNNLCPGRPLGCKKHSEKSLQKRKRSSNFVLDEKSLTQAHRYVPFNVVSVSPFREEHKRIIKGQNRSRRIHDYEINKIHCQQFSDWFKRRVGCMDEQGDQKVTEEIKWLASSQVDKVFYSMDPKHIGWEIVWHVKLRDVFYMGGGWVGAKGGIITSTDIPIDSEIHDQSSEFSATDIPTEGEQSGHPQTTEGGQSTAEEHSSTEGG